MARKNARLFAATLDPALRVEPLSVDPAALSARTRLLLGALGAAASGMGEASAAASGGGTGADSGLGNVRETTGPQAGVAGAPGSS